MNHGRYTKTPETLKGTPAGFEPATGHLRETRLNHYTTLSKTSKRNCHTQSEEKIHVFGFTQRSKEKNSAKHKPFSIKYAQVQKPDVIEKQKHTSETRACRGRRSPASPTPTSCLCDSVEERRQGTAKSCAKPKRSHISFHSEDREVQEPPERQPSAKNEHAERKPPNLSLIHI